MGCFGLNGLAWLGLGWLGLAWLGLAWFGLVGRGRGHVDLATGSNDKEPPVDYKV